MKKNTNFIASQLEKRYEIGKKRKQDRLVALYIKPIRQGRNFVINANQLQLMDDLDKYLKAGGNINEFVQKRIESGEIVPPEEPQAEAIVIRPEVQVVSTIPQLEQQLVAIYEATENFTIPGLKEKLEQHRAACKQARKARNRAHNFNDFMSQALKLVFPDKS